MDTDLPRPRALDAAEPFFKYLFDAIPDGLILVDDSGAIKLANRQSELVFGYAPDELVGRRVEELLPRRYRGAHEQHRTHYEDNPHTRPMGLGLNLFALRKDGTEIPVEISLSKVRSPEGDMDMTAAVVRDVSEHRRMEEALRQHEERLQVALTNSPTAVFSQDKDLTYTWAYNPPGSLTVDWFVGRTDPEIFGDAGEKLAGLKQKVIETGENLRTEVSLEVGGGRRDFDVFACPRLGPQGELTGVSTAMTDISEQKEAARTLAQFNTELEKLVHERTIALAHANAQLQQTSAERGRLYQALLGSQERERARLSRDLHDHIGQALTGVSLLLDDRIATPEGRTRAKQLVAQTIDDVRRLARALRPSVLDEVGLEAALKQHARELAERSGLKVEILVHTREPLAEDYEIAIYRIVQEALTNVIRHADAEHASVVVTGTLQAVQLTVEDDGKGFDPDGSFGDHLGLASMRERVDLLGGVMRIESGTGEGTSIHVRLPKR